MSALVDDHERIWLQNAEDAKHQDTGRMWCEDKVWPDNPEDGEPTEYVRADLFTTLQSRLETANRSAGEWEDLHRELFNAVYACTDPADKVCGLHPGPERDELEAVIGRHKTVHRREGPYASSVSYKARLEAVEAERDAAGWRSRAKFKPGERVTKTRGSSWTGRIVGVYETSLTPIGYCVESENEPGSVQIYPESALAAALARTEEGKP